MPFNLHIPGRPKSAEPHQLVKLAAELCHPDIMRFGITATIDGQWALLAIIKPGVKVPIIELEKKALKFPVIYLEDNGTIPVARPAYPYLGE